MKLTPEEKKIQKNFEPGKITRDGFLGADTRHIHEIIKADLSILSRLGIDQKDIADQLQYFIDQAKGGLETEVDLGDYMVKVIWTKGVLPCPFGKPGLHHKIIAEVLNKTLNEKIIYSQLNVHMIREHGFFEGKGSKFRLEPDYLIKFLNT